MASAPVTPQATPDPTQQAGGPSQGGATSTAGNGPQSGAPPADTILNAVAQYVMDHIAQQSQGQAGAAGPAGTQGPGGQPGEQASGPVSQ
jgi:hypothetical protein